MYKVLAVLTICTILITACDKADTAKETALALENVTLPARDDVRLAVAYKGLENTVLPTPPLEAQPRALGERELFWVHDGDHNTFDEIEAELLAVSDHAYFWFETGENEVIPDEDRLTAVAADFDAAYERVVQQFGQEAKPGIDGDPRLYILHASPQAMCGKNACWVTGYFDPTNSQPLLLDAHSNEHEMFVMGNDSLGRGNYILILAHEFRHMIEANHDLAETDWGKEGSAVLAEGFSGRTTAHSPLVDNFMADPDQQLNDWAYPVKESYYGQAFLFNKYLFDRLGQDLYREFATSSLPGFEAIDQLAEDRDLAFSGHSLWLDWLAALVLHEHPQAGEKYEIGLENLRMPRIISMARLQLDPDPNVHQFAADYYGLPIGESKVSFNGSTMVPLLTGQEVSDEMFWYSGRANYSNPRLTRSLDLREVESPTLVYDVFFDIEEGWDFAYVAASSDGGTTWEPLAADNMRGLDSADDPSGMALAPRFYTGSDQTWRHESIDLTPYAGQEILLRFEVVTDGMMTESGLAIDNVSLSEIGYTDDESGEGWTAEGFTLASASLPQTWHLQLIEYMADGPVVSEIPVKDDGTAEFTVTGEEGQDQPILIIAASAPMTLEPAKYQLLIED